MLFVEFSSCFFSFCYVLTLEPVKTSCILVLKSSVMSIHDPVGDNLHPKQQIKCSRELVVTVEIHIFLP